MELRSDYKYMRVTYCQKTKTTAIVIIIMIRIIQIVAPNVSYTGASLQLIKEIK